MTKAQMGSVAACTAVCALTPAVISAAPHAFHIRFAAAVGQQPFVCGKAYDALGSRKSAVTPNYFRFYVSDVRLVDAHGNAVPLALDQDGTWQQRDVALLSFEGKNNGCADGSPLDHNAVSGLAPDRRYVAVRFSLGVPESLDHADATIASSPLNLSEMFWSWQDGYKFLRFDARVRPSKPGSAPIAFVFHLGSSGCSGGNQAVHCREPNRPEIALSRFDPEQNVVVADVAALLAEVNLDASGASGGCMSDSADACASPFAALGLAFGGGGSGVQHLFSVR